MKAKTKKQPPSKSANPRSGVGISELLAACIRCGKPFKPEPTGLQITKMSTCCDECKFRNLMDGLDLPTPPEMLDRHTKLPTLTDEEYRRKLNEPDDA